MQDIKQYVRNGSIHESGGYLPVLRQKTTGVHNILVLLEGTARRKLLLSGSPGQRRRFLVENYYPVSFIGLEDYLTGRTWPGATGVFPSSHYIIWPATDFMTAFETHPSLARRAINALSRRIRFYDERHRHISSSLRLEQEETIAAPEQDVTDALYQLSFSDENEFPEPVLDKLGRSLKKGDILMKQGGTDRDLFILLEGRLSVYHENADTTVKIDEIEPVDLVGEMAQFDLLPRSATVVADADSKVLCFSPENFHIIFQLHPRWSRMILETLARRIQNRREELVHIDRNEIHD